MRQSLADLFSMTQSLALILMPAFFCGCVLGGARKLAHRDRMIRM
jgi:hypothetical protein